MTGGAQPTYLADAKRICWLLKGVMLSIVSATAYTTATQRHAHYDGRTGLELSLPPFAMARRMSRTTRSAGALLVEVGDFWLICILLAVTMSRNSSVPQLSIAVSRAQKADTDGVAAGGWAESHGEARADPRDQSSRGFAKANATSMVLNAFE
jgi:hypothetical protein